MRVIINNIYCRLIVSLGPKPLSCPRERTVEHCPIWRDRSLLLFPELVSVGKSSSEASTAVAFVRVFPTAYINTNRWFTSWFFFHTVFPHKYGLDTSHCEVPRRGLQLHVPRPNLQHKSYSNR